MLCANLWSCLAARLGKAVCPHWRPASLLTWPKLQSTGSKCGKMVRGCFPVAFCEDAGPEGKMFGLGLDLGFALAHAVRGPLLVHSAVQLSPVFFFR